jgi:hypothetical protein
MISPWGMGGKWGSLIGRSCPLCLAPMDRSYAAARFSKAHGSLWTGSVTTRLAAPDRATERYIGMQPLHRAAPLAGPKYWFEWLIATDLF